MLRRPHTTEDFRRKNPGLQPRTVRPRKSRSPEGPRRSRLLLEQILEGALLLFLDTLPLVRAAFDLLGIVPCKRASGLLHAAPDLIHRPFVSILPAGLPRHVPFPSLRRSISNTTRPGAYRSCSSSKTSRTTTTTVTTRLRVPPRICLHLLAALFLLSHQTQLMTQLLHIIGEASTELPTGQRALADRRERPQQTELGVTDGIITDVIVTQPTLRLC